MAGSTLNRFVAATGDGKGLTCLKAANRHIRDEPGVRVTVLKLFQIYRHFDDALADGFGVAGVHGGQKPSGDITFRNGVGFDDPDKLFRF